MADLSNFSEKMQGLRKKNKLSLEELADKTGYSAKYLQQIENNEVLAPVSVILSVSQALSVSAEDVLTTQEERKGPKQSSKQRKETLEKRADQYSYEVLTPKGKNKHLNAFRVTIEPQKHHKMVAYHHPGEEFIYVLEGELEVKVGTKKHLLSIGESIHFDSSKAHQLKSASDTPTVILVAVFTP